MLQTQYLDLDLSIWLSSLFFIVMFVYRHV